MAGVMAQQSQGLSVPTSRQDVISALLNDYGTSFGRGDGPSALSPVPADKELPPPPPPRSDSLRNKPLPAVQRAEQRMSMKFQLRVIEDAPLSPSSVPKDSSSPRPRKKILYRSLSRDAKPPSLNLLVSNGSTAVVPPTPALSARAQTFPISKPESKSLPSPPPPPPAKSARRSEVQRKPIGLQQSKSQTDLARNDSLLSNGETKPSMERPATVEAVPSVKRKALPAPAAKKFVGLAQLGTGPRGGKGGPLPPTSAPRKKSVDDQTPARDQDEGVKVQNQHQRQDVSTVNQMPPTPEEDKSTAPAPPRKVALGLPSNPRAKGGPVSPMHVRGKSSTGFGLLKAARPAPPIPTKIVETLTPEMTPSPTLKPEQLKDQAISPLSPLPPPTEQRRPFSFEPLSAPAPPPAVAQQPRSAVPIITPPTETAPSTQPESPIRPSSADLSESSPSLSPASTPVPATTLQNPETSAPSPIPEINIQPSPVANTHPALTEDQVSTPPPFTPLTRAPIPLPQTFIPAITAAHLSCYTNHKNTIWSNNTFQPMGCMICRENDRERKWCCTWCQLRICMGCSEELCMVPGRQLEVYLEERGKGEEEKARAEVVLSAVYERDEDFS